MFSKELKTLNRF